MLNPTLFERFLEHAGHHVEVSTYALPDGDAVVNVAIECFDCNSVLFDADRPRADLTA